MDIAAMSVNQQLVQVQQAVSVSIMKMAMDVSGESSAALIQALDDSGSIQEQPYLGSNIDVTV